MRKSHNNHSVINDNNQARRRRFSRRRALVLLVVQLAIIAHVLHWLTTGSSIAPLEPSEAISFARDNVITPGLIVLIVAVLSTVIFGRFFCGWACHLLAVQDGCAWLLRRLGIRLRPLRSKVLRLVPIAAFIWMFLVPLFARINGPRAIAITTEWHTTAFWETFPGPFISVLTLVVAGCYVVYLLGNKAYCNYACPYGAIIGASDSFSVGKIVVDADKCNSCMDCTRACSSDVVVHHEIKEFGAVVDNNCMKTLDCVAACPNQALSFQISKPAVFRAPGNPSAPSKSQLGFKQELILAVGFLFGFFATHDLFGAVPFLLALGFGLVSAHGALLLSKNKISFDLNKKNIAWIAACLFFIHAAVVQSQALVRDHWFDKSFDIRMAYLRGDVEVPLTSESLELLQTANKYAQRVSAISYAGHERNDYIDGWAKLFDGDRQGFEQAMHRVLERRPGFGEVLFQLGIHHWVSGSEEQAIATLASIQESDGKYAIAQEYISKITSHQLEHQH